MNEHKWSIIDTSPDDLLVTGSSELPPGYMVINLSYVSPALSYINVSWTMEEGS